ncbi:trace amine-associated receptor 13c-like [Oculina patagonica]
MANLSGTNSFKEFRNITKDGEAQNASRYISIIITVIFNCITCPFTVLLNVLVIMAMKKRPRLQTYTNILLACLAVTDALTGLLVQPTFILYHIDRHMFKPYPFPHNSILLFFTVSSALRLVIVTCDRLIAIKFTMHYPYLVTNRSIKKAVITCWVVASVALTCTIVKTLKPSRKHGAAIIALVLISCILFIAVCYVILYLETLRHRKQIKTQQLPQEEVERFAKESKALKTTVYVVGAVMLCFIPMATAFVTYATGLKIVISSPWIRTAVMLNPLLNPLIYCWRQKEMRHFVFRIKSTAVAAIN